MNALRKMFNKDSKEAKESGGKNSNQKVSSDGAPGSPITTGSKLGKDDFEVLALLGKGSFAKVVLCRQKGGGKKVYAMKIVMKSSVLEHHRVGDVFTEKNILRRAGSHPFLVQLYYTFQSESKLFFVMDYMAGGDLDTYFNKFPNKRLDYSTAKLYSAEILLALQFLHENQCIYRDLKPENILLSEDGHVTLADFGLSKDFLGLPTSDDGSSDELRTASFVGSPFYVAPDVLRRKQYSLSIDYWSYGILLYRMVVGKVPFAGRSMKEVFDAILHQDFRFSSITPPDLHADCKDLIAQLLHKDGQKRITGKAVKEHPYFKGVNWDLVYQKKFMLEKSGLPPQWTPPPLPKALIDLRSGVAGVAMKESDVYAVSSGSPAVSRDYTSGVSTPRAPPGDNSQQARLQPPTDKNKDGSSNPEDTHKEVMNTPVTQPHLHRTQQQLFEGFSYFDGKE